LAADNLSLSNPNHFASRQGYVTAKPQQKRKKKYGLGKNGSPDGTTDSTLTGQASHLVGLHYG
jgi:hypothetical protein